MLFTDWLTLVGICALGALSPGPSLAVIMKHTLAGGRYNGAVAALTHAAGIGLYALLCISGLAVVITASPRLYIALQWAGAAYLVWLGVKGLLAREHPIGQLPEVTMSSAARDGFMIVFLNPKIAVFFIALFAQVVGTQTSSLVKCLYATTAMVIDGGWYLLVAWLFSNPRWLALLQRKAIFVERIFGLVLLALASKLIWHIA